MHPCRLQACVQFPATETASGAAASYMNRTSPLLVFNLRNAAPPGEGPLESEAAAPAAAPQLTTGRTGAADGSAGNSAEKKMRAKNKSQKKIPERCCGARGVRVASADALLLNVPCTKSRQGSTSSTTATCTLMMAAAVFPAFARPYPVIGAASLPPANDRTMCK